MCAQNTYFRIYNRPRVLSSILASICFHETRTSLENTFTKLKRLLEPVFTLKIPHNNKVNVQTNSYTYTHLFGYPSDKCFRTHQTSKQEAWTVTLYKIYKPITNRFLHGVLDVITV